MGRVVVGAVLFATGAALVWFMTALAGIEPYTVSRLTQATLWGVTALVGIGLFSAIVAWFFWVFDRS